MKHLFITVTSAVILIATIEQAGAQTCGCEEAFDWTRSTFEQRDAGFQYIIDNKGQRA